MRLFTFAGIILLIISCSTGDKNPIEGVWELDRMSWNDTTITPLEPRQVKIYRDSHVMYSWYNISEDSTLSVGFGTYTYTSGNMTETITNHNNPEFLGQSFSFKVKLNNQNSSFDQDVMFGDNKLSETWKRIE